MHFFASVVVLATVAAGAPVSLPDTPAGQAFSAWLTAFDSADHAKIEAMSKQFRQPRPVAAVLDFRRRTGGFEARKILESTPTRIRVLLEERAGEKTAEAEMEVDATPPHLVTRWDVHIVSRPPELAIPRLTEAAVVDATKAQLDELVKTDRFSGAVLIARHGKAILNEVRGLQDRDKKIANRLDTKFNLGSMNKMFTAVAIAQLAQQGKLDFSDPVGKFLPDYPNAEVAKKVTIHQLLTHTGGMGDIFTPEYEANIGNLKEPKDYITLYGKRAPEFEPGSKWSYSNYGMVVAGAIVERVSGMSYYDYVRKNIYEPAGMINTDSYWKTKDTPNLAKGYVREDGVMKENVQSRPLRGSPAGGGYSTREDLLRFATALTTHKLLDADHVKLITTGKPGTPDETYGYGFGIANDGGVRSFGHDGGAPGINSSLKIFPEAGYVVIVMGNYDPPAASRLSDFISARLPAK